MENNVPFSHEFTSLQNEKTAFKEIQKKEKEKFAEMIKQQDIKGSILNEEDKASEKKKRISFWDKISNILG